LIWLAERVWDGSDPIVKDNEEYKYHDVYEYLKQRRVFGLASHAINYELHVA
jgi:hypothetical protein